ncbi:hypothetical protein JOM56_015188 [Amanita muscaria]
MPVPTYSIYSAPLSERLSHSAPSRLPCLSTPIDQSHHSSVWALHSPLSYYRRRRRRLRQKALNHGIRQRRRGRVLFRSMTTITTDDRWSSITSSLEGAIRSGLSSLPLMHVMNVIDVIEAIDACPLFASSTRLVRSQETMTRKLVTRWMIEKTQQKAGVTSHYQRLLLNNTLCDCISPRTKRGRLRRIVWNIRRGVRANVAEQGEVEASGGCGRSRVFGDSRAAVGRSCSFGETRCSVMRTRSTGSLDGETVSSRLNDEVIEVLDGEYEFIRGG